MRPDLQRPNTITYFVIRGIPILNIQDASAPGCFSAWTPDSFHYKSILIANTLN